MDILSHALWILIIYFNNTKRIYAVLFGMLPDIITIIPHLLFDYASYTQTTYDITYRYTHSLVVFLVIGMIIYLLYKQIIILWLAWGVHIIIDIFTHPSWYYPTPYLFPFYSPSVPFTADYRSYSFLIINYFSILAVLSLIMYKKGKSNKRKLQDKETY